MLTYSALQRQYPLSSKKFTKKIVDKLFLLLILDIGVCLIGALFIDPAFLFIIGIVFPFVCFFAYAPYVNAYIARYYYDAGPDFVTIKKGVFAPAEIHVQYQKIQDVYVDQDIIDRMLGLYDVHIASATVASGIEAHIDGVEKEAADGLKELLLGKLRSPSSQMPPMQGAPGGPGGVPPTPAAGPVIFTEELSSKTYPIAGAWVAEQFITGIFSSLSWTFILFVFFALPGRNSQTSFLQDLGLGWNSIVPSAFVLFAVIYFLNLIYQIVWRSTYSFQFLPDYIVMRKGVLSRSETHTPYRAVQDVNVSQGIIDRIFGLARVSIENAAAAPQAARVGLFSSKVSMSNTNTIIIPGQPLDKANHLSDVVKSTILKFNPTQTGL